MGFALDIAKFAKETESTLDEASRAIKIALFNGVIRDTRVDTGRLRGNWQTTTWNQASGTLDRFDKLPQGANGGAAQDEAVKNVTAFGVDYLANNLPYAEIWEERDGMIAKNIARIERNVKEVAARVRKD